MPQEQVEGEGEEGEGEEEEEEGEEGEGEEGPVGAEEPAPAPPPRRRLQPFEVPTSGAFWLHDDRFDDSEVTEEDMRNRWAGPSVRCWVLGQGPFLVGGFWEAV